MGLEVSATTGALWPLTPRATSTLSPITAGSGAVETPTTSGEFVTAWETLSAGSGGTIDASGVTDVEGTLNIASGGTAAVVVQGGSYKNLTLTGVQNLRFEDAVAVTTPRARNSTLPPNTEFSLTDCINVQFIDCIVTYDLDNSLKFAYYDSVSADNVPTPNGWISITGGYDILFDGCYIEGFFTAFTINNTSATGVIEVLNTEIKGTQNDDFRGGGWQSVRIEGCYLHDHYQLDYNDPDGQHSDMIQIWSIDPGLPSDNITIKDNILKAGAYGGQGIFLNVSGGGTISNVTVENNLIYNSHFHGISFFAGVSGSTINRNTVLENTEAVITNSGVPQDWTPGIRDASGGNTITDNVCLVVQTGTGTVSSGNYFVTYGAGGTATDAVNHFINPYEGADATLADLKMKTGSILFGSKGSTLL